MVPASAVLPLLGLAAAFCYGAGDFFGGLAARRAPVIAVTIASQGVGLLLTILLLPLGGVLIPSPAAVGWGLLTGIGGGLGVALLYRALATGLASVVAPITAVVAMVVPVLVGLLLLGERPSPVQIAGLTLGLLAVWLLSRSGAEMAEHRSNSRFAASTLAIASGVFIGFFLVCLNRAGSRDGGWPLVAARCASVAMFLIGGLVLRRPIRIGREVAPAAVASGLLDIAANILFMIASRFGTLTIVSTLANLYPASTVLLSRLLLKERIAPLQGVGLALALAAVAMITWR